MNIKRNQGETFASFAARQKLAQETAHAEHEAAIKSRKDMRRHKPVPEVSDFDYSMNG